MPWSTSDVDGFRNGLSKKQKQRWVGVANSFLKSCVAKGGSEKECAAKAVRTANSKFTELNPVLTGNVADIIMRRILKREGRKMDDKDLKKFQYQKQTPPDPIDNHVHNAAYDEDGNGGTSVAGDEWPHSHVVYHFKLEPFYEFDEETRERYISTHPGSLAFAEEEMTPEMKKKMEKCMEGGGTKKECMEKMISDENKMGEIEEMEIFRIGTHNGDDFTEEDLEEIAENFEKLKSEVRPKLKITHHEHQKSLAGLASYGDITEVYTRYVDGEKRLFAKIENVPKEVIAFIKERRFPERSIEIYPEFKLGVKDGSPVYKNVLKAIALLGQEMPAVTGMAPIMLSENLEKQKTICFDDFCMCEEAAEKHLASLLMETSIKYLEEKISKERSNPND